MKSSRRLVLVLGLLAACLCLFVAAVRFLLPAALERLKSDLGERYGILLSDVNDPELMLDRIKFGSGRVSIERPQLSADLTFQNLAAEFDLADLLSGKIGEVTADSVDVRIDLKRSAAHSAVATQNKASEKLDPADKIPKPASSLPFKQLTINSLTATVTGISGLTEELKLVGSVRVLPLSRDQPAVELKKLTGGIAEKFYLTGAEGSFEIGLSNELTISNAALQATVLEAALPIGEPTVRFSYGNNTLKLLDAHGKILEGAFSISPGELSIKPGATNKLTVELKELSIPAILALYPSEKVSGEGKINAVAPLTISPNGVSAQNGSFSSVGSGMIRTNLGSDSGPASLKVATRALENLHFDSLGGTANLAENGVLNLAISMSGYNPDLNKDQPFNVNITVEENLKSLYKSLSVSKRITDSVSKRP